MSLLRRATALSVALACAALVLLIVPLPAAALEPDVYVCDDPAVTPALLVDQTWAQDRTLIGPEMDFARIHVEAGTSYVFSVLSKPGYENVGVRMTLVPDLFGSGQSHSTLQQATTSPSAAETDIFFTATETGTVVLQVEPDQGGFGVEYAYWLAAYTAGQAWWEDPFELPETDPNASGAFVSPGDPAVERALSSPDDVDTIDFFVPSPGDYVVSTGFSAKCLPPDTQLEVRDLGGPTTAVNDDGPDGGPLSEVRITATEAGVWRARVSSVKDQRFGAYTLAVSEAQAGAGRVRGQVIGPTGDPVAGAQVSLLSLTWTPFAFTTSDANGRFDLPTVPLGVPYRVAARADGSGLVSALNPEVRNDPGNANAAYNVLTPDAPSYSSLLRLQLPWVQGKVGSAVYAGLAGLDVNVYDLGGSVLGTGVTDGAGRFKVSLPEGTEQCRVKVSDPSGEYRVTWYTNGSTEPNADVVYVPTFDPLEMSLRKVSDPDFADNHRISLAGVEVVFDRAALPDGMGVLAMSPAHPVVPGFRFVTGRYYDITPYMAFWGGASVTLSIPPSEAAGASRLRMFHWKDGAWHDVTSNVDTVGLKVTGRTDSFSEFAIMAPTSASEVSTPASSPWSIALFAALIALSAAPLRRAGRA
jgi:hypothetical protein